MRLSHLNKVAKKIGIDGLAVCGNEADLSFFDEYHFEGLMDEPWYELMNGKEMRSLFKKTKKRYASSCRRKLSQEAGVNAHDENSLEIKSEDIDDDVSLNENRNNAEN